MAGEVLIREEGAVATIAFDRPAARNALTLAMLQETAAALGRFAARGDLRVVVLRGAGELPFSAGYDMTALSSSELDREQARAIHAPVRAVADAIQACPHPVVGAARGYVYGAALDLFAHCDLRLCADDTRFCMPPNRHGFLYPVEGMARLAAVAGATRATAMVLLGAPIHASEAQADGLVNKAVAGAQFEAELAQLCTALAANAPLSMRASKQMLGAISRGEIARSDDACYGRIADCLNSADSREAMAAFQEKRSPVFKGR